MKVPFVDLNLQYKSIKKEIDNSIKNVIAKSAYIKGEYVEKFESNFARSLDSNYSVSCANGTDALFISLKALNVGIGDEVITTAMSWISTSEAISLVGAKVVFVDVDKINYNIDIKEIEKKITKKTKAIIPVHLYGLPTNMTEIMRIAKKYKLLVIEDCAQAHYAKWKNKYVGTFGSCGTFSFYPSKNLGAFGDAGAIITNKPLLAKKIRMLANHGSLDKHNHKFEGINSRMDGLQAAILNVKIKYIHKWNAQRLEIAKLYNYLFRNNKLVITPNLSKDSKHVFHLYVIRYRNRAKLINLLKKNKIATSIHYPKALPFLDAYKYLNYSYKYFPNAYTLQNEILSLPIYPGLSKKSIFLIANLINKIK